MAELTTKQEQFCLEYLKDFNATQAAIRAGYSPKTAVVTGHENLRKPDIKKKIDQLMSELVEDKNKIIIDNVRFWIDVRSDLENDMKDRLKASEYLGKYAAMFTDRLEIEGNINLVSNGPEDDL
jgi:phage terminase small subunit